MSHELASRDGEASYERVEDEAAECAVLLECVTHAAELVDELLVASFDIGSFVQNRDRDSTSVTHSVEGCLLDGVLGKHYESARKPDFLAFRKVHIRDDSLDSLGDIVENALELITQTAHLRCLPSQA